VHTFQVDAMLQKLEKEIDDVDAKIGDRWRLLDRFVFLLSWKLWGLWWFYVVTLEIAWYYLFISCT
jgi:hypothetical protein